MRPKSAAEKQNPGNQIVPTADASYGAASQDSLSKHDTADTTTYRRRSKMVRLRTPTDRPGALAELAR